jgi:Spy/CpxP family protein refolding chaperone
VFFTRRLTAALAITSVAVLFSTAGPAAAQARRASQRVTRTSSDQNAKPKGPVKWWEAYRAELGLNSDQVARIAAIFDATFPQLVARYDELRKSEDQLSSLISANDATEAQVLRQADQIEALRGELSKTRVLMLFRMRRVLSPEQREKLQVLQREREKVGAPPPAKR